MAHAYTRVTLVGQQRHLDLLLPSDQPVAGLMPQVLDLLEDVPQAEVAAKVLVAADGRELAPELTLDEADILDGSSLQLCSASSAPPAPIVYDVTDLVVSETEDVPGRWNRRWKDTTGSVFAAFGLWAGAELLTNAMAPQSAWWLLAALSVLAAGAGILLGRRAPASALGPAVLGAGWLAGTGAALHVAGVIGADGQGPGGQHGYGYAGLLFAAVSILALLALAAANRRSKAMYTGALILGLATAGWVGAVAVTPSPVHAAALASIAGVLLLGLLPGLALSASGLAALDDSRAKGGQVTRVDALSAVAAAHGGLVAGTAAAAASVAVGLWILGTDTAFQIWSLPLMAVLTLAVFLRARSFPLAPERLALYATTAVGLAALVIGASRYFAATPWVPGAGVLLLAAAVWLALALEVPDHTQARFRLAAKRLETLAILASVPLAAGMFGIFAQLLESF